jgi:hypothetical protein
MFAGHDEGKGKEIKKMEQNLLNSMDQAQIQQMKNTMVVLLITEVVKAKK